MRITILTLFPKMFDGFQHTSILKRAIERDLVTFECIDYRSYTKDKHNHVDDTPCGGGAGMVLMCQPILDCIQDIRTANSKVVMLTPQGKTFHQKTAHEFAGYEHLILLCGHYEGFDERIREAVDMELSLGDFVLTGGECAAMVISDAIIRLIDGVIQKESHEDDSFEQGLLEYPQYTRPIDYHGKKVPEVLLSGHHENIRKWRLKQSLKRTLEKRPDLLELRDWTKEERQLMNEIQEELSNKDA